MIDSENNQKFDDQSDVRAVIDIGSNSVKLLIARVYADDIGVVQEQSVQTRLAKGIERTGDLSRSSIRKTLSVLREFIGECIRREVVSPLLFATSAMRQASREAFSSLQNPIWREFGLSIKVINPALEAKWAFIGVTSNPEYQKGLILLTDIGGGSAQFSIGYNGKFIWSQSGPLGAVRLLEQFKPQDPPTQEDRQRIISWLHLRISEIKKNLFASEEVKKVLMGAKNEKLRWVGAGGAATILASMRMGLSRFNRKRLEGFQLSAEEITKWVEQIWTTSLSDRKELPGLHSRRADITLTGAAVYQAILDVFKFDSLSISTRGGRYGAVLDAQKKSDKIADC